MTDGCGRRQLDAKYLESAVNLYCAAEILDNDVAELREAGYHIVRADTSAWLRAGDVHSALSLLFDFPGHYGRNWNAFNDCMRDVRDREYGFPAAASGLALVLTGFDVFAARYPDDAHTLLDRYADHQRAALIDGDRLVCLVQSADPRLILAPVGAMAPRWNRAEWSDR